MNRRQCTSHTARTCAVMGVFGIVVTTMLSNTIVSAFCPINKLFPGKYTICNTDSRIFTEKEFVFFATTDDSSDDTTLAVDELLEQVDVKDGKKENLDEDKIRELMTELSSNADQYIWDETSSSSLFEPLIGYYNVSCTITAKPNDNPVGGKWTRGLWTVKRTMQHVLPPLPADISSTRKDSGKDGLYEMDSGVAKEDAVAALAVAQVINAIRLELLWGFVNIWVLLRGDAVPLKQVKNIPTKATEDDLKKKRTIPKLLPNLSDRTVKAYFDRPKIGLSLQGRKKSNPLLKRVLTLGPTSAVVLDTPYADTQVRLGKGGTSGSQFVFRRLPDTDKEAIEEWKWVLEKSTANSSQRLTKNKLLFRVGILGVAFSILSRVLQQHWMKTGAAVSAILSGISMIGILNSTGGIETKGDTYMVGKQ